MVEVYIKPFVEDTRGPLGGLLGRPVSNTGSTGSGLIGSGTAISGGMSASQDPMGGTGGGGGSGPAYEDQPRPDSVYFDDWRTPLLANSGDSEDITTRTPIVGGQHAKGSNDIDTVWRRSNQNVAYIDPTLTGMAFRGSGTNVANPATHLWLSVIAGAWDRMEFFATASGRVDNRGPIIRWQDELNFDALYPHLSVWRLFIQRVRAGASSSISLGDIPAIPTGQPTGAMPWDYHLRVEKSGDTYTFFYQGGQIGSPTAISDITDNLVVGQQVANGANPLNARWHHYWNEP